jgi:mevalonate kinase
MMTTHSIKRKFHGKILLFGEYSVILGSMALAIPYRRVSARLQFPEENNPNPRVAESNHTLGKFAVYLLETREKIPELLGIDILRFQADIRNGLYLESTIPGKYGLGSSGALCAAVYSAYGIKPGKPDPQVIGPGIRRLFAGMESFFHGSSSGIDPLCIYSDTPLIIENADLVRSWIPESDLIPGLVIFLLDTRQPGQTGMLVHNFRQRMEDPLQRESFTDDYIPLVNRTVSDLTGRRLQYETIRNLSYSQLKHLDSMIPENFMDTWKIGLETNLFACKLCGSGGGGMILGFTPEFNKARKFLLKNFNFDPEVLKF